MDINYTFNKLCEIIENLAIGEGDIKSRIRNDSSNILVLFESDFPEELKQNWESIYHRLTKRESKYKGTIYDSRYNEGSFEATMHLMRKKTASKIASDIVALRYELGLFMDENGHD